MLLVLIFLDIGVIYLHYGDHTIFQIESVFISERFKQNRGRIWHFQSWTPCQYK